MKRIPRLLSGILLKGLIQFRMEVFKRNGIDSGKWITFGFFGRQNFKRGAGINQKED